MSADTTVSRRSFLALAGALPFALKASAAPLQARFPSASELYSVRDELAKDLTGTVRTVAKMVTKSSSSTLLISPGRPRKQRRSASCSTISACAAVRPTTTRPRSRRRICRRR